MLVCHLLGGACGGISVGLLSRCYSLWALNILTCPGSMGCSEQQRLPELSVCLFYVAEQLPRHLSRFSACGGLKKKVNINEVKTDTLTRNERIFKLPIFISISIHPWIHILIVYPGLGCGYLSTL